MKKKQKSDIKKKDFRRIIAPVDGSNSSKRSAKKAIDLAKNTNTDIIALYVVEEPLDIYPDFGGMYPDAVELIKQQGKSILDDIKKMGSEVGVDVKTKMVEGHPVQEIIKEAGKNDLIIIGCKGKSALKEILMGSVCQRVFHHSSSHVMVVK